MLTPRRTEPRDAHPTPNMSQRCLPHAEPVLGMLTPHWTHPGDAHPMPSASQGCSPHTEPIPGMLTPHRARPGNARHQSQWSLVTVAGDTQAAPRVPLLPAAHPESSQPRSCPQREPPPADVPHRRGWVLPPGTRGDPGRNVLRQVDLRDTVTQREALRRPRCPPLPLAAATTASEFPRVHAAAGSTQYNKTE